MSTEGLVPSFLGALQASLAVLLTISYGVIAAQFKILEQSSAKQISKLCVRMFLPALLISNVGSQLRTDTAIRYVPVLIWSLFYTLASMGMGFAATRIFKLPSWTTPAVSFNNTTSLPLLLIQSLDSTGILDKLLLSDSDTTADAVKRAKSYFLVCSIVGNSLTFALGPKLLDGEEAPDQEKKDKKDRGSDNGNANGNERGEDIESGRRRQSENQDGNTRDNGEDVDEAHEETSLLPDRVVERGDEAGWEGYRKGKHYWERLPSWAQSTLDFLYAFLNAPLIGAIVGIVVGLVPPFHKAFFNEPEEGGFFKAWLTSSIKNVGDLFAALQLVVVGVKLSSSLRKMKQGEDSGTVPWIPMLFVFFVRFILWPILSITIIWAVAAKTNWLNDDPILWFSMMLMPTGPPAIKLTALADVNGSNEEEKMSIAKFLTIAYTVSPVICFAVVGSLKASQAAMK
ncbi:MAG: hypothetical protein M1827_006500 [Pycnora praestabilis]|nr:MAG: hypothetical protein M1827_006500 [Pycnora praestabilis]